LEIVALPRIVAPSKNTTVPDAVAGETLAVSVTACPVRAGFAELLRITVGAMDGRMVNGRESERSPWLSDKATVAAPDVRKQLAGIVAVPPAPSGISTGVPPGGVKMSMVAGGSLPPVMTGRSAVPAATFAGEMEESENGARGTGIVFEVALPFITESCAVPAVVVSEAGSDRLIS
jgi:hypothetical protein